MTTTRRLPGLFTLGLVVALIASAAVASVPDPGGRINACYALKDGLLRVIDTEAGQTCTDVELPISWSSVADITGVTAGSGLSGGASTGEAGLSVNTDQIQTRIAANCPVGQFMIGAATNGDPKCETPAGGGGPGGTGDITGVAAGTGMSGGGTSGDVTLGVSFKSVQARVSNLCPASLFMVGILESGEPSCGSVSTRNERPAISRYQYRSSSLEAGELARMRLQPGAYVVFAKVSITPTIPAGEGLQVQCRLVAGTDRDDAAYGQRRHRDPMLLSAQLSLNVVNDFAEPGNVILTCEENRYVRGVVLFNRIRITAIPVPGVDVAQL